MNAIPQRHAAAPAPDAGTNPQILVIPVAPGDTIPLPLEPQGLQARVDINGNLAVKNQDEVVVLQGYIAADLQDDVVLLADNGQPIDLPLVIAGTGPEVDFPTAGGFVSGTNLPGNDPTGSGIFTPFGAGTGLGPLSAVGVLDGTDAPDAATPFPSPLIVDPDLFLPLPLLPPVTPSNTPPIAANLALKATEDGPPVDGAFSATDPDPADAGKLVFTLLSQPAQGLVTDHGDGTFSYDPQGNFQELGQGKTATVSFTYQATDPSGAGSNVATVTVTISGVNDPPSAQDLQFKTTENAPVASAFSGSDPDGDQLSFAILAAPTKGTVTNNGDGTFSFDPGTDFDGLKAGESADVTFTYQSKDSTGAASAPATVIITVAGINDVPAAEDVSADAKEDGPPIKAAFKATDVDDPASGLTFAIDSDPAEGTVANNNDGTFTFSPGTGFQDLAEGEARDVQFSYTASDAGGAASNTALATITVTGVNDAPTAADKSFSSSEDGPVISGDLAGDDIDSDDDPTTLGFVLGAAPAKGTFIDNGDGTFSFDPGTDFDVLQDGEAEDVTFTYQTQDSHGALSAPATVTITVTGINDPIVAENVTIEAKEDGDPVTGSFVATDPDDDPADFVYEIVSKTRAGSSVVNNGDGTFTYDPGTAFQDLAEGETINAQFAYRAIGPNETSDLGIVTVVITGVNDTPLAKDASFALSEDGPPITQTLFGDDVDSDDNTKTLNYVLSSITKGTLTDHGDGTFSFDPGTDFDSLQAGEAEDVSFTYQTKDAHGALSAPATITITVTGVNDHPISKDVTTGAFEDGGPVTAGFSGSDPDDADVDFQILTPPSEGTVVDNHDNTFTYDPGAAFQELAEGETTAVTFIYDAKDSHGIESDPSTATITITGKNDDPTSDDILIGAAKGGVPVTHDFIGDDIDSDDDQKSLTYVITTLPLEGTVINNGDGTFTFDPGADFDDLSADQNRPVTFTYTATDQHGTISTVATVSIVVFGSNTPPIASDVAAETDEDSKVSTAFAGFDVQDPSSELIYSIVNGPAAGTVTLNQGGTFTFDPGADFHDLALGQDEIVTFTYTATDDQGLESGIATVQVTVHGLNDAPAANAVAIAAKEDGLTVSGNFLADDVDSDDDPASLVYKILAAPAGGTLINNNDGTFGFAPGSGFQDLSEGQTTKLSFTYQATDSHGKASNIATGTITLTGVNDLPTAQNLSATVLEGTVSAPIAFKGDDIDSDDTPASLSYAVVSPPNGGSVIVNKDGTFAFDPGTDFDFLLEGETQNVTFTYQATDAHSGVSDIATVTITVTGQNVAPVSDECPIPDADILATYTFTAGSIADDDRTNLDNKANHWIQGYGGNDILQGGSLADLIEGGDGNDQLTGQNGADILLGGTGDDKLLGLAGDDCLDGDEGNDNIQGGGGNDHIHGQDGNDNIQADQNNDEVDGGAGNDIIHGGIGLDHLIGGDGDDEIFGEGDSDTLEGGAGNDTLNGGGGSDIVFGGDGDDTIIVAGSNNLVTGGQGNDSIDVNGSTGTIFYTSVNDGNDTITSFDGNPIGGQDLLNLDQLFDSLEASLGPLDAATRASMVTLTPTGANQNQVFVDEDHNAATAAVQIATITSADPITVGQDIIVI